MSVKPGVATPRTIPAGQAVGTTRSETQGAPTPLEYGRKHLTPANIGTVS